MTRPLIALMFGWCLATLLFSITVVGSADFFGGVLFVAQQTALVALGLLPLVVAFATTQAPWLRKVALIILPVAGVAGAAVHLHWAVRGADFGFSYFPFALWGIIPGLSAALGLRQSKPQNAVNTNVA